MRAGHTSTRFRRLSQTQVQEVPMHFWQWMQLHCYILEIQTEIIILFRTSNQHMTQLSKYTYRLTLCLWTLTPTCLLTYVIHFRTLKITYTNQLLLYCICTYVFTWLWHRLVLLLLYHGTLELPSSATYLSIKTVATLCILPVWISTWIPYLSSSPLSSPLLSRNPTPS